MSNLSKITKVSTRTHAHILCISKRNKRINKNQIEKDRNLVFGFLVGL